MRPGEGCGLAAVVPTAHPPGTDAHDVVHDERGLRVLRLREHGRDPRTPGLVPRRSKRPRRLVADARTYLWTLRPSHGVADGGRSCRQTLTLYPRPAGVGGPPRIVFTEGPGRYVPMLLVNPGPRVTSAFKTRLWS